MKRYLVATVLALAGVGHAQDRTPRVVLVSVDGLMPADYLDAGASALKIPNLKRLMATGSFARGVIGVLPTVTYPSHTTLISGVPPRVHGVESNSIFDPEGRSAGAWYWYASAVRVPTLLSAARARGLSTAAVGWPVSVGAPADLNFPEYWRSGSDHPSDLELLKALATPELLALAGARGGTALAWPVDDDMRTDLALAAIEARRPALTLLHLAEVDHAEHVNGPRSPEARAAVEATDARLGRLIGSIAGAGIAQDTLLAIVSDHCFLATSTTLYPNTLLRDAGLLTADAQGRIQGWRAVFHADGGLAALHVKDPADAESVGRVRALFEPRLGAPDSGLREILDAAEVERLGGSAAIRLALNAQAGFAFSAALGPGWSAPATSRGNHGYAPNRDELLASLIFTVPGRAPGGDVGVVPMTRIAPMLADWLGLELSPQAAEPLLRLSARR